jgi:uncharacterized protein (DUF849 family)
MGTMGGIGPDVDNVVFMKRTADRLLGDDLEWSILGSGRFQMNLVTVGAIMGISPDVQCSGKLPGRDL